MTHAVVVGNDVVDLLDRSTAGKHKDPRFVARILAEDEQAAFSLLREPAVSLWAFWAAKESAYKVASKLRGELPVFAHRAFRVTWDDVGAEKWAGAVRFEESTIPVLASRSGTLVHAVAALGAGLDAARLGVVPLDVPREAWVPMLGELRARFTEREADAVHSLPSAVVRIRARATLAETLGVAESDVEIVCDAGVTGRRPPRALVRGLPAPADVSLSHHGRWIGWAVLPQNPFGR